jgi:glutamate/tyrosine decarboxylase-like PLP-dependent enzyme
VGESGPGLQPLARGLEAADSWATDAHKWLNVPYDSGLAFVRDANALKAAMAITAEYLPTDSAERNPSDFTPELSRRARGLKYGQRCVRSGARDLPSSSSATAARRAALRTASRRQATRS